MNLHITIADRSSQAGKEEPDVLARFEDRAPRQTAIDDMVQAAGVISTR